MRKLIYLAIALLLGLANTAYADRTRVCDRFVNTVVYSYQLASRGDTLDELYSAIHYGADRDGSSDGQRQFLILSARTGYNAYVRGVSFSELVRTTRDTCLYQPQRLWAR